MGRLLARRHAGGSTGEIARSALDAAEFINARKITFFSTVPSFLAMITRDLTTVRLLVVGGDSCSAELVQRWVRPNAEC